MKCGQIKSVSKDLLFFYERLNRSDKNRRIIQNSQLITSQSRLFDVIDLDSHGKAIKLSRLCPP